MSLTTALAGSGERSRVSGGWPAHPEGRRVDEQRGAFHRTWEIPEIHNLNGPNSVASSAARARVRLATRIRFILRNWRA